MNITVVHCGVAFDRGDLATEKADDWDDLTPEFKREMLRELRGYDRQQRWAAFRMLWGPAIKDRPLDCRKGWTVYDGYVRQRGEEWTFWRALVASGSLLINRRHTQRQVDRHIARTGRSYIPSLELGFWDSRSDGYGYSYAYLHLYPWGRISVGTDGESLM
ncbi:hypothetical protein [Sphingomonas sp. S2-65]|uniref:hypothetical protein n=1 Tax=Sphingomonas sp. S2-65 TaxID=2903960 RepID=UPI001F487C59|nr:hypothetical protein [Sphingomonas sp. S2-65]UYY60132.1 hypothetical protein LZ586_08660 [Sphingomonas sp. S2-65]